MEVTGWERDRGPRKGQQRALIPSCPAHSWPGWGASSSHPKAQGYAGLDKRLPTLLRVWVCPMRMRALEEIMDRQKLMRMTDRSERMYL